MQTIKKNRLLCSICAGALAVCLIAGARADTSTAYFTAYDSVNGGKTVAQVSTTTVTEKWERGNFTKTVSVTNTGNIPCYVRVKFFKGSEKISLEYSGDGWTLHDDGYVYYNPEVAAGTTTGELVAKVVVPEGYEEDFNVIVVEESTPVLYNEAGEPYANWELKVS